MGSGRRKLRRTLRRYSAASLKCGQRFAGKRKKLLSPAGRLPATSAKLPVGRLPAALVCVCCGCAAVGCFEAAAALRICRRGAAAKPLMFDVLYFQR